MSLMLRRRGLLMQLDATAPPPPVLWDSQNAALNQAYTPYLIHAADTSRTFAQHSVVTDGEGAGTISLNVGDRVSNACAYAAAVFGLYDLTRCSTVTLQYDRYYYPSVWGGGARICLGIWQPDYVVSNSSVNHPNPNVFNYVTIERSGSQRNDQTLEVDVSDLRGAAYIVPEIITYLGNGAAGVTGGKLWIKRLAVS